MMLKFLALLFPDRPKNRDHLRITPELFPW